KELSAVLSQQAFIVGFFDAAATDVLGAIVKASAIFLWVAHVPQEHAEAAAAGVRALGKVLQVVTFFVPSKRRAVAVVDDRTLAKDHDLVETIRFAPRSVLGTLDDLQPAELPDKHECNETEDPAYREHAYPADGCFELSFKPPAIERRQVRRV